MLSRHRFSTPAQHEGTGPTQVAFMENPPRCDPSAASRRRAHRRWLALPAVCGSKLLYCSCAVCSFFPPAAASPSALEGSRMRARLYLLFYGRERKCAERAWRRTRSNINTSERAERNISDSFMSATADDLDGTKGIEVSVIEEENNVTSNTPTVESINLTINCKKTTKYCSQVYPILGKVTHFEMLLGVTFCLVAAGMLTGGVTGGVLYFIDKNRPMMPPPTMPPLPPHVPSPWLPPSSPEPPSPPPPPATCRATGRPSCRCHCTRASAKLDDVWDGDPCLVQERCVTGEERVKSCVSTPSSLPAALTFSSVRSTLLQTSLTFLSRDRLDPAHVPPAPALRQLRALLAPKLLRAWPVVVWDGCRRMGGSACCGPQKWMVRRRQWDLRI